MALCTVVLMGSVVFSCSSSDNSDMPTTDDTTDDGSGDSTDDDGTDTTSFFRLVTERSFNSSSELTGITVYQYNSMGFVLRRTVTDVPNDITDTYDYIYAADQQQLLERRTNGSLTESYEYSGDRISAENSSFETTPRQEYFYDTAGNLERVDLLDGDGALQCQFLIQYDSGNLISFENTCSDVLGTFTFDDKNSPSFQSFPLAYALVLNLSENNILTQTLESSVLGTFVLNHDLEYNSENFLIRMVVTDTDTGTVQSINEYEYQTLEL